jgi:hypothetical protein
VHTHILADDCDVSPVGESPSHGEGAMSSAGYGFARVCVRRCGLWCDDIKNTIFVQGVGAVFDIFRVYSTEESEKRVQNKLRKAKKNKLEMQKW